MRTKDLFCANCQIVTTHNATVDGNGEFVFTCTNQVDGGEGNPTTECGRFVKFPADTTPEQFVVLAQKHEEQNVGQVSEAVLESRLDALLGAETPVDQ